jgi:hypothetical protein
MKFWNLAIVAALLVSVAFAQSGGTLSGTVVALADGTPLPKAQVRAKNTASGALFSGQTSEDGRYGLSGLPAGVYEVSAEFPLFIPLLRQNVQVQAGQTARLDFRLDDVQLGTLGDSGIRDVRLVTLQPAPSGPTPRMPDGKPDLSGVWLPNFPRDPGNPEPLPWAEALRDQRSANLGKDWPQGHCLPNGILFTGFFLPYKFVQTPTLLIILDEADLPRQVFLDGREHPKDPNPSFMGHSIGRWEGDTLVVDTIGINDRTWLNMAGLPHTEQMRVVERYRRPDLGHLETEITVDDPGAYKKPWTMKRVTSLAPKDVEIMEWVCTENNKDVEHLVGR